jgi:hypothetical protein
MIDGVDGLKFFKALNRQFEFETVTAAMQAGGSPTEDNPPAQPFFIVHGGSPRIIASAESVRDKTTIRKLENTVAFLQAQLANEVLFKDDVIAALTKSEAAYNQLHADFMRTVDVMEAKHKQELSDLNAQHTIASDAASAEVRGCCDIDDGIDVR